MANSTENSVDPKHYTPDSHKISPDQLDPDAIYVIEKLKEAGYQSYLVGGGVRDLLFGVTPKDYDVSTSAKPEEIKQLFRNSILIGRRFRLAHIRFGKKIIEVATFRSGESGSSELIVRDNVWGTEEEDVLRRDFTINGLFYDPHQNLVIDYVEGYPDIQKRILRTIGQPDIRFSQDPVRMIRLIKFCARFKLEIDPPTFEALLNCKNQILKSSSARIFEELLRMLESGSSRPFFHLLKEYGFLAALLPELSNFMDIKGNTFMLDLLGEVDQKILKDGANPDRALLLSLLIFPVLDEYLQERQKGEEKPLHLGQIESSAYYVIDCVFSPFFAIPRKIRGMMGFLLSSQYRFVPLNKQMPRHPRLSKDSLTPLALDILELRSIIQPELVPFYELWTKVSSGEVAEAPPQKRRRRRYK